MSPTSTGRPMGPNATPDERRWLEQNAGQLSATTRRAKWVHGREGQDRPGQTLVTRDPEVIRRWAEERNGTPAAATFDEGGRPRTLRMMFNRPQRSRSTGEGARSRLQPVDWDAWLEVFRQRDLAMLFQETRRDGSTSVFFRLDSPEREDG